MDNEKQYAKLRKEITDLIEAWRKHSYGCDSEFAEVEISYSVQIYLNYRPVSSKKTIQDATLMNNITYKPIGVVHSPFKEPKGVPIQAMASKGIRGTIEINPEYAEGIKDLEGFSHIILIYHFSLVKTASLTVKPFLDDKLHGVFATRSPARPNAIGLSIVQLTRIENNTLYIQDLDIVDDTPLLDVKPYVPKFDYRRTSKIGWFSGKLGKLKETKDDGRFCNRNKRD